LYFCWRTFQDVPGFRFVKVNKSSGCGEFWPDDLDAPLPHRQNGHEQNGDVYSRNGTFGYGSRKKKLAIDFAKYLNENGCNARERELLAYLLGVDAEALRQLQIGWASETKEEPEHWLFPERDGSGVITGLLRRYPNGEKKRMFGSRSGLVFDPAAPFGEAEVLLIVEGPTDVAAALTMGLQAVGRPNNLGGWELLAPLIRQRAQTRGTLCVTLGENDQKEDGRWPGKDGAVHSAGQLMRLLRRGMPWCMPPEGVKDLLEWLWRISPNLSNKDECCKAGREVLRHIYANVEWVEQPVEQVSTEQKYREDSCICKSVRVSLNIYSEKLAQHDTSVHESPEQLGTSVHDSKPGRVDLSDLDSLTPAIEEIVARARSAKWCRRHFTPLLQGRSDSAKGLVLRVSCRRWSCPQCVHRQRYRRLEHFVLIFELQTTLYAAHITARQLRSRTERIRRNGGDYLVISQADDRILLIANRDFPDSRAVTAMEAAGLVAQALQNFDTAKRKPVSTSWNWRLCELRKEADYVRRGAAPRGGFLLVVGRLKRAGLNPVVGPDERGKRASWRMDGYDEAQRDCEYEELAAPRAPGEVDAEEE
jgi:hypothetical protein